MKSPLSQHTQPTNLLAGLFLSVTGNNPEHITPLATSGSPRRYFRLSAGNFSLVGAVNEDVAENLAFGHFAQAFRSIGLHVPEVLALSRDKTCYLQQDLGDVSLYRLVQQQGGMQQAGVVLANRFRQALKDLALFQTQGYKVINFRKFAFAGQRFDKAAILDDLQYFRYFFVRMHPSLAVNERRLMRDMERFARLCAAAPSIFFMYRDFQSRNIMIHQDQNYYIDFQGGKQGALQYDVVSLLWQALARFSHEQRSELIAFYKSQLNLIEPEVASRFDDHLPLFVHLRQMQVLGAYGLRGLAQKKAHFLKSIPFAIRSVADNLQHYPLPEHLDGLKATLWEVAGLADQYPIVEEVKDRTLTVNIFSFSYLQQGIPADTSGNGGGFVFDCRALPNPGREERFRLLTGKDEAVRQYLETSPLVHDFLQSAEKMVRQSIDDYLQRGFTHLSVGFGCTGGQHRSVYCAEKLAASLGDRYPSINIALKHFNLEN